jgi:RND superfamily putative drug exporter
VIFAAGAVMVAVSSRCPCPGLLPPKEMGIILGFAVLRDALLVRLILVTIPLRLAGRAAGGFRGGSTSSSH